METREGRTKERRDKKNTKIRRRSVFVRRTVYRCY